MDFLTVGDLTRVGIEAVDLTRQGTRNRERRKSPAGLVVHTPSRPWVARIVHALEIERGIGPDAGTIDDECAARFDLRKFQGGYMIGWTGRLYCCERDDRRTSHAGGLSVQHYRSPKGWRAWAKPLMGTSGYGLHGRPPHVVYDWWNEVFGRDASPLDLPSGRYPNSCIGIDVRPHQATGEFSSFQAETATKLIRALADCHDFPVDIEHVLTHSLAAPLERGSVLRTNRRTKRSRVIGVHWDPSSRLWNHRGLVARAAA